MNKKRTLVVSVIILILLTLISCSSKSEDNTSNNDNMKMENDDSTENAEVGNEEIVVVGTIEDVKGNVLVIDGNDSGVKATDGMEIAQGSSIKTAENASATIIFSTEMEAYISSSTHVSIEETENENDEILLTQHEGFIYHAGEHDNYYVQTETTEATPIGTHFFVEVNPYTGDTMISVIAGIVSSRTNQSSSQPDDNENPFEIHPSQSAIYHGMEENNDEYPEPTLVDLIDITDNIGLSFIEALLRNKEQIDNENEEIIERLHRELNNNSSNPLDFVNSEEELSHLEDNLNNLISNIINMAINNNRVSEEEVRRIISEINENNPERPIRDILNRSPDTEQSMADRREQLQREQERRLEQQRRQEVQNQQDRNRELLAKLEQQRADQQEIEEQRERERRQRLEEIRKIEEQKKKEKEEQQKREKQLLSEETAPTNLSLKGLNYFGNDVSGEITFNKSKNEKYVNKYNLYWINNKDKKIKIDSLKPTGKNLKYKLGEGSKIPSNAKGVLVESANSDYESRHTVYKDLTKLNGKVSFSKPIVGDGLQFAIKVNKHAQNSSSIYKLIDLKKGTKEYDYEVLLSGGEYEVEYGFVHGINDVSEIKNIHFNNTESLNIDHNGTYNIKYDVRDKNFVVGNCENDLDCIHNFDLETILGEDNENISRDEINKNCILGENYKGNIDFTCGTGNEPLEHLYSLIDNINGNKLYNFFYRTTKNENKMIILNFTFEPFIEDTSY